MAWNLVSGRSSMRPLKEILGGTVLGFIDLTLNGRLVYLESSFIVENAFLIPGGFASLPLEYWNVDVYWNHDIGHIFKDLTTIFWSSVAATCWFTKSYAHTKQAEHRKAAQTIEQTTGTEGERIITWRHNHLWHLCISHHFPHRSVLWQVWHQGCSVRDVLSNPRRFQFTSLAMLALKFAPKAGYVAEHSAYHHGSLDSIANHDLNGDKFLSLLW